MIFYIITFLIITALYIKISIRKKTILNILAYNYCSYGLLMVFLYIIKLGISGEYFTIQNGDILMIIYFIAYFLGCYYIITSARNIGLINLKLTKPSNIILWLCIIIIGFFILNNRDILAVAVENPRMFYANTRIGGGFIYYVIIPFCILLYFIMISNIGYSNKKKHIAVKSIVITSAFFSFLYIFGQKSTMLRILFIFLTTLYYQNRNRKINIKILKYIVISGIGMFFVASLYFKQQSASSGNILLRIVNYSDYLSNFNDLIKYLPHHFWGKVFMEDEFISFIPRAIWKNKPELFGSLKLGIYVPRLIDWTKAKTGAPSFGPLGQVYADFGVFGIFIKLIIEWIFIWIASIYDHKLSSQGYNFFYHWIVLTFCGIKIFNITMTTFPIYQLSVIYMVYQLSKVKIKIH